MQDSAQDGNKRTIQCLTVPDCLSTSASSGREETEMKPLLCKQTGFEALTFPYTGDNIAQAAVAWLLLKVVLQDS